MKLEKDLTLGMSRKEIMMYSDLVEDGKLVYGESGGNDSIWYCADVTLKGPYDDRENIRGEDAARLLRESVAQTDFEFNGKLNVPKWLGFYSGNEAEGRRPLILLRSRTIKPASNRLRPQYSKGMKRMREMGYDVQDTGFRANHGADEKGKSIFYDFGGHRHKDWRLG